MLNGNCGGFSPGRLPLLIGDTDRCPVAQGNEDPEVLRVATLLPGPYSDGALAKADALTLPTRWRRLLALTQSWRAEWTSMQEARHGE